jgi:hypothetical protein
VDKAAPGCEQGKTMFDRRMTERLTDSGRRAWHFERGLLRELDYLYALRP